MTKQIKRLSKVQVGPRTVKCPVCGNLSARITTTITSSGRAHKKMVCYATNCRSERYV